MIKPMEASSEIMARLTLWLGPGRQTESITGDGVMTPLFPCQPVMKKVEEWP